MMTVMKTPYPLAVQTWTFLTLVIQAWTLLTLVIQI